MKDSTEKTNTNTPDTIEATPDLMTVPSTEESPDYTVELSEADALATDENMPDPIAALADEAAADLLATLTDEENAELITERSDERISGSTLASSDKEDQEYIPELEDDEEEEADRTIELTDEDGLPVLFEFLALIEYEGETYAVLLPAEESDQDSGEVEILRVTEDETEEDLERYEGVEEEDIRNAVFQIFQERFSDQFDFE